MAFVSGFRASAKLSFLEFPSFNILPRDKNDREILPVLLVRCFSTEIYNWYFLIVYLFKIFRSTLILSIVIARSVPAMLSARSESWKYFDYIFFEIFTLLYFLWYLLSGSTWLKDTLYDIHCLGQVGYHAKKVTGIVRSWEQR